MTLKAESKKLIHVHKRGQGWSLFFYAQNHHHIFTMRPINELINSGKTLTKKERAAVERHIEAHSERISIKELNDMKCLAAIRKRSKYGPYG